MLGFELISNMLYILAVALLLFMILKLSLAFKHKDFYNYQEVERLYNEVLDLKYKDTIHNINIQNILKYQNLSKELFLFLVENKIRNLRLIVYLFSTIHGYYKVVESEKKTIKTQENHSTKTIEFCWGKELIFLILQFFGLFLLYFINNTYSILLSIPLIMMMLLSFQILLLLLTTRQIYILYCMIYIFQSLNDECILYKKRYKMLLSKHLKELQWKQYQHDIRYHKDIWVLPVHPRATHMVLHLCKYSGKLFHAHQQQDFSKLTQLVIDILIINISYANIFSISLYNKLEAMKLTENFKNLEELIKSYNTQEELLTLLIEFSIVIGTTAKTIESLDHIEHHNFRESLEKSVIDIFIITLKICAKLKVFSIEPLIEKRLYDVESRNGFFNYYGNYRDGYL